MNQITLPEEKLNELAQEVSAKLVARHYFDQGAIKGNDLKGFADHTQVNRFLIFQVFQVWEMQINKLYHPYFNMDNPEIQQTIQALKNQISQHISIGEEHFQPMLKRAVYNNLKLILNPRDTFESFFFAQTNKLPIEVYRRYGQFFSDMDFIVNSIQRYYEKNQIPTVEKDVFFIKMEKAVEVYNRRSGKSFDDYRRELFQDLTGKELTVVKQESARFLEEIERKKQFEAEEARRKVEEEKRREEEAKRQKQEEEARRKAEEARRKISFFDSLESEGSFFDLEDDTEQTQASRSIPQDPPKEETPAPANPFAQASTPPPPIQPVVPAPEPEPIPEVPKPSVETKADLPIIEPPRLVEEESKPIFPPKPKIEPVQPEAEPEKPAEPKTFFPPQRTVASKAEEELNRPKIADMFNRAKPEEEADKPVFPPKPKPAPAPEPKPEIPLMDRFKPEPAPEPVPPTPTDSDEEEKPQSVLDKINERRKTIADQFNTPAPQAPSANGQQQKIKLDEIPIHKQYQYVQKVFEGNNVRFRIIVDKVNNAKDHTEVEEILDKFVLSNTSLNQEDAVVKEFIQLLRNRF